MKVTKGSSWLADWLTSLSQAKDEGGEQDQ
jgi:hypothetical protein